MNIGEILIAVADGSRRRRGGSEPLSTASMVRWKFKKLARKAAKEDREEEKADKTAELTKTIAGLQEDIKRLRSSDAAQSEALKQILLGRVLYRGGIRISPGRDFLRRRNAAFTPCTTAATRDSAGTEMQTYHRWELSIALAAEK
ncbi:MAG: hypothetical protein ACLUGP_07525 [Faecalibacterium prausnitzii]